MMLIMMWMVMVMMMMLAMMKTSTAQPAAFLSCSGQPPKMKKYLKDAETPAWICYILRLHSRRVSRRLKIPIPNFLDNIHS